MRAPLLRGARVAQSLRPAYRPASSALESWDSSSYLSSSLFGDNVGWGCMRKAERAKVGGTEYLT